MLPLTAIDVAAGFNVDVQTRWPKRDVLDANQAAMDTGISSRRPTTASI